MSHHHDHDHPHHHHHGHSHDTASELPFEEKLARLLAHWIKHNDDHAGSYRDWAEKARSGSQEKVAAVLDQVAEMTEAITDRFKEALSILES